MPKRILKGEVVSNAAEKTVVVNVKRTYTHPIYKKIIRRSKRYHAHDEKQAFQVGDFVQIVESKPISKTKKWQVIYSEKQ
ncbi:MAG: 30S ribosomal protein S17 [Rickettsiales bacterium]